MTRVLGRLMSLEMIVLGLCELALSFLVIYGMLTLPGAFPVLTEAQGVSAAQTASPGTANLAAMLALHDRAHGRRDRPLPSRKSASSGVAC